MNLPNGLMSCGIGGGAVVGGGVGTGTKKTQRKK